MRYRLSTLAVLLIPLALAACGGGPRLAGGGRYYTQPGPAGDPWRPYIQQASARFGVPENWIRAVMQQESGGHATMHGQPTTSATGAMGLMQLMPATYAELRDRYGLGNDPYDPHDNIMAGTGYIAELYRRYGSPAFLAAYNAGPHRLDMYNAGQGTLPNETVDYLASVAPALGGPMSGPLAAYADAGGGRAYTPAYSQPVYQPAVVAPVEVAEAPPVTNAGATIWGGAPQPAPAPPPQMVASAAPPPPRPYRSSPFALISSAQAEPVPMSVGGAGWGVQVGAFTNPGQARQAADTARTIAPAELAQAQTMLGTANAAGGVLYRARLVGITHPAADSACGELSAHRWPCLTVAPGG